MQGVSDLTGNHVGFVRIGQRNNNVRVGDAGTFEDARISRVTDHRAYVEPILEFAENLGSHIDDRDLIRLFPGQMIRGGRANLARTEY